MLEKETMIRGDSSDYDLLEKWAKELPKENKEYILSCEIGVREGLGSKIILDNLQPNRHIGIDPYGNLKYQHYDNGPAYTADYTEGMRLTLQKDLSDYECFDLFHMTDTEFMRRYQDLTDFNLVHFDGPHMTKDVITEAVWFADRSRKGSRFIFDDYKKYGMEDISKALSYYGFNVMESGQNKIMLQKL